MSLLPLLHLLFEERLFFSLAFRTFSSAWSHAVLLHSCYYSIKHLSVHTHTVSQGNETLTYESFSTRTLVPPLSSNRTGQSWWFMSGMIGVTFLNMKGIVHLLSGIYT